jgi:ketosteroid isomerase-like protein
MPIFVRIAPRRALRLGAVLLFALPLPARAQSDSTAIATTVRSFAAGAATRDMALLMSSLHPLATQLVRGREVTAIDRNAYLAGVTEKRIGGVPLTVELRYVHVRGDVAFAEATFSAPTMVLKHALTLMRIDDQWVIVTSIVTPQRPAVVP